MTHSDLIQRSLESLLVRARAGQAKLLTVTAVAAAARISRASLYRYHPHVISQIQAQKGRSDAKNEQALRLKVSLLMEQLKRERETNAALARACAELAADAAALRQEFEDEKVSLQLRVEHLEKKLRGGKIVRLIHPR